MPTPENTQTAPPALLHRGEGHAIAYHKTGGGSPTLVFLTGLRSDMTGSKALALEAMAKARGQAFLRFDYRGHGASEGRFEDGAIGDWLEDTLGVIDALTEGPLLLVGSSLGGWLMLLAARARPERIAGLVGIAPAADFTELMWQRLDDSQRARLKSEGRLTFPSQYDPEPFVVTRRLIEEGRTHLLLEAPIPFAGPVRLIHGIEDPDVPWLVSVSIADRLTSPDVEIILVKGAGHRLSDLADLARLCKIVEEMSDKIANSL